MGQLALAVATLEHRPVIVAAFHGAAVLELLMWRLTSERVLVALRPPIDFALLVAAVWADDRLWASAVVVAVCSLVWRASRGDRRLIVVGFVVLAVILALGWSGDVVFWLPTAATAVLVTAAYVRMSLDENATTVRFYEDLSRVLRSSPAMVYEADVETGAYLSLTGPVDALTGWTHDEWMAIDNRKLMHPDDVDDFWMSRDRRFAEDEMFDRKARFRRPDGSYVWLRDVSRVSKRKGRWVLYGLLIDVSELENAYQTIRHQAEHDPLTGVSNRILLREMMEKRLNDKRIRRGTMAVFVVDLNRFKDVNDSFGHEVGDRVLVEFARRLETSLRPDDHVARLGGDEFAVLANRISGPAEADAVAQRITAACEEPFLVDGMEIRLGLSIGVAVADSVRSPEELLRRADAAMYTAKRTGRTHHLFVGGTNGDAVSEIALAARLPAAIEAREFEVWFQPKVSLSSEYVTGAEALVRWRHPELGILRPDAFLHLVHLSDRYEQFTEMVFEQSFQFMRDSAIEGRDLRVAVNVSVRSLYDPAFPNRLNELLVRHGVRPSLLILEITEQEIMEDSHAAPGSLARLAQMGVTLSIDDFGTGYSSLARLRDLPVSEIKIDRRFVGSAPDDDDDHVIVESIIDLAENLGLRVVAEGVERQVEAQMLLAAGCDEAQGHLYGPAMPPAQFLRTGERLEVEVAPDLSVLFDDDPRA